MRFTSLAALLALSTAAQAQAQDYSTQLLAALNGAGLTTLATVIGSVANTTQGAALVAALPRGNLTVLAPTNGAFEGVPANVSSNTTLLTEILSYHVLNGTFNVAQLARAPAHTIGRTALRGDEFARLPNNRSQAIVLSQNGNGTSVGNSSLPSINIYSNLRNVTSDGTPIRFQNLLVIPIGEVLNLPPTLSAAATAAAPQVAGLLTTAGLVGPLESLRGMTVFVPSDSAVAAVGEALGTLNSSQVVNLLSNHVINSTVAYSTSLSNTTRPISLTGEAFTFAINGTGVFVTSGNVTAKVIQADIILTNGVAHVIDRVLVNTAANPAAVQSATSVAASATMTQTEDAGVGATATPASPTSGGGQAGGGGVSPSVAPASGAGRLEAGLGAGLLGALVAFMI